MRGIILAAGRGSRMKKLTDERPKCLVELRGKTLLDWQLSALREAGIHDIAIVTGYRRELLGGRGLTEFHNARWAETNMLTSLACAEMWLRDTPCIMSYSDIFFATSAILSLINTDAALAITYDPDWRTLWEKRFSNPLLDAETFRLNTNGTLAEIGNKPQFIDEIKGQYMGLLRCSPEGWHEIQRICQNMTREECDGMHMTGVLQKIIEAGRIKVSAIPYSGTWGEVDSAQDLAVYQE